MSWTISIRQLPLSERPRERLSRLGSEALSEQELLACLLGRGVAGESVLVSAQRLLGAFGSLRGIADASLEQLATVHGIGGSKATQLKAAAEIARRLTPSHAEPRPSVTTADAAAAILKPLLLDKPKEHFIALLLDTRYRLIRPVTIAVGSLSATLVHPRELFREAIACSAAAVLVAHNHPSGDPSPSPADLALTQRLRQAGELLGIALVDHVIVAREGIVSLLAEGHLGAEHGRPPRPFDSGPGLGRRPSLRMSPPTGAKGRPERAKQVEGQGPERAKQVEGQHEGTPGLVQGAPPRRRGA